MSQLRLGQVILSHSFGGFASSRDDRGSQFSYGRSHRCDCANCIAAIAWIELCFLSWSLRLPYDRWDRLFHLVEIAVTVTTAAITWQRGPRLTFETSSCIRFRANGARVGVVATWEQIGEADIHFTSLWQPPWLSVLYWWSSRTTGFRRAHPFPLDWRAAYSPLQQFSLRMQPLHRTVPG